MSGAVTSIKISKWSRKAPEVRDVVPIEKGAFFVSLFHHCEMRSSAALKIGSIIPLPSTYYYSLSTQASSLITNTYRQTQRKSKKKIPIGTGRAPSTWSPTLSNLTPLPTFSNFSFWSNTRQNSGMQSLCSATILVGKRNLVYLQPSLPLLFFVASHRLLGISIFLLLFGFLQGLICLVL